MFEKEKIDLIYRVICLLTFMFVTLLVKNIITLAILILFFYFSIKKENDLVYFFLSILTFLSFAVGYVADNYTLLKLMLMIDYIYYFLSIPSVNALINSMLSRKKEESADLENEMSEEELFRFKNIKNKKKKRELNLSGTIYLTFHLGILFLSIVVGSCVI